MPLAASVPTSLVMALKATDEALRNAKLPAVTEPLPDSATAPVLVNLTVLPMELSAPVSSMPPVLLIKFRLSVLVRLPTVILPVPSLRPMVIPEKPSEKLVLK